MCFVNGYPLNHPLSLAVFLLWQLAHLTSVFFISFCMDAIEYPCPAMTDILCSFLPLTWSNSRTVGSDSPQSKHG